MAAGIHDFVHDYQETRNFFLTDKDAARAPIDLTGYAAMLDIYDALASRCMLTVANGGILLAGAASGQFEIDPSHALYMALTPGAYQYRLMLIPPNNESRVILRGKWTIR